MARRTFYPASDSQARRGIATHLPLTAPGHHPEWDALLSNVDRSIGFDAGPRAAEIAVMLAGWFLFGFLLGMLFLP